MCVTMVIKPHEQLTFHVKGSDVINILVDVANSTASKN